MSLVPADMNSQRRSGARFLLTCRPAVKDGTLVLVKSGAQFARGPDDWKFFNGAVVDTVRRFHEDGYKVVIFTCAFGISLSCRPFLSPTC